MKPTARQLIESITWSLDNKVAPLTDDKWAASTLRSVRCLLLHLAERVETEGALLFEDNADLRDVLDRVDAQLAAVADEPGAAACRARIADALGASWRSEGAYPSVASLTEENDALRAAADAVLVGLRGDELRAAREEVEAWVRRRLLRDQPMFLPAFMSKNF